MAASLSTRDDSFRARAQSFVESRQTLIEVLAVASAVLILLVSTIPNLANHPVLTDDEIWVMSSAYKLAEEGVFGSDMFTGFFNAESKYYFNLPGHHIVMAAAFKLFGAGVIQARAIGIVYGIATLVLTYLLGRKLFGVPAAILSIALLLFVRFNIGFDTGLPLQEQSVSMRYDLAPIPFMLGATFVLLGGTSWQRCAVVGALIGIASLMQFYGAFMLPVAIAFLVLEIKPRQELLRALAVLLVAFVAAISPYLVFIASDLTDYRGQAGTIDDRADFTEPGFYIDNLIDEPDRFLRPLGIKEIPREESGNVASPEWLSFSEMITRRPSAKVAVLVGLPVAVAFLTWNGLARGNREQRLVFLALAGLVLQLTLLDSTKFFFYWIPVIPFLILGLSGAIWWLLTRPNRSVVWIGATAFAAAALLLFAAEGTASRVNGIRTAQNTQVNYEELTARIHSHIPTGSRVVGSTAMWWGLRDTDYRSYFLFFYLTRPDAGEYKMTITEFLDTFRPDYLVLTHLSVGELITHLIPSHWQELDAYMKQHYTRIQVYEGADAAGYAFVDIWQRN